MRLGHTHRSSGCSSWMNELSSVHDRFGYSVTVSLERVKIQAFKSRGFANYLFLCPEIHKSNSATRSKWILQARRFWSFQHLFEWWWIHALEVIIVAGYPSSSISAHDRFCGQVGIINIWLRLWTVRHSAKCKMTSESLYQRYMTRWQQTLNRVFSDSRLAGRCKTV